MSSSPSSKPLTEKAVAAEIAAYRRLRIWNGSLAVLHAAQAIVILALSNSFTLPLTLSLLKGPPGTKPSTNNIYNLRIGPMVALFLLLAALDHALVRRRASTAGTSATWRSSAARRAGSSTRSAPH